MYRDGQGSQKVDRSNSVYTHPTSDAGRRRPHSGAQGPQQQTLSPCSSQRCWRLLVGEQQRQNGCDQMYLQREKGWKEARRGGGEMGEGAVEESESRQNAEVTGKRLSTPPSFFSCFAQHSHVFSSASCTSVASSVMCRLSCSSRVSVDAGSANTPRSRPMCSSPSSCCQVAQAWEGEREGERECVCVCDRENMGDKHSENMSDKHSDMQQHEPSPSATPFTPPGLKTYPWPCPQDAQERFSSACAACLRCHNSARTAPADAAACR